MSYKFIKNRHVKFRYDIFGGLSWFPRGDIFHLTSEETALLDLLDKPRDIREIKNIQMGDVNKIVPRLLEEHLILPTNHKTTEIQKNDYEKLFLRITESTQQNINKPFWVHVQPFTFCNQHCIHCYCEGSIRKPMFSVPLAIWKTIIDKLDAFGILDVYVTGGECLIVEDCLSLIEYIIKKGLGTGLSTNAMHVTDNILKKIEQFNVTCIQVSLDGASSKTNDFIRGTEGAFKRTVSGIVRLQKVAEPVINTVVNKLNMHEIEGIISLGVTLGICQYKMFPQKAVGRALEHPEYLLSNFEIHNFGKTCRDLATKYGVEIEYPKQGDTCGSGYSGFSINEMGDVFPCILVLITQSNV